MQRRAPQLLVRLASLHTEQPPALLAHIGCALCRRHEPARPAGRVAAACTAAAVRARPCTALDIHVCLSAAGPRLLLLQLRVLGSVVWLARLRRLQADE
jgi:hypothetical protein